MNTLGYQKKYRRNLPHFQPEEATLFLTFRLADSIPVSVQKRWHEERRQLELEWQRINDAEEQRTARYAFHQRRFKELEDMLDRAEGGPIWLRQPAVARIAYDSLLHRDQSQYRLDAFCVMSNHVHSLFRPLTDEAGKVISLSRIMHSLKTYTASECNKVLARTGNSFWQDESYDHYVRDEDEWIRILHYILRNPIKAGIVTNWRDYPFTYCSEAALAYVTI